jgi:hypothetical protein
MAITRATDLAASASGLGANPAQPVQVGTEVSIDGNSGIITANQARFTGNVTVGGVLTYDDVTNIDSIGLITARSGIQFGASGVGGTITATGDAEFVGVVTAQDGVRVLAGGVGIADSIFHLGDDNARIRFPSTDTFAVETAGEEALRVDSSGRTHIGASGGTVGALSVHAETNGNLHVRDISDVVGSLTGVALDVLNDASNSVADLALRGATTVFRNSSSETLRIDSSGRLLINTDDSRIVEDSVGNGPQGLIQIEAADSSAIMSIISAGTADANRCGTINLGRHRNSTVGGTPTVVQNGDALGSIVFSGGDGTDMRMRGATIIASCDGAPGGDDMPGRLMFSTRADGGGMSERLRIDSNGSFIFKNGALIENGNYDTGSGLSGDYNHDLGTHGNVHYSSSNAAAAFTYNLRINSSVSLNSVMAAGDTISFTLMHESNNASYYMTAFKIDGTTQSVKWSGGSAPSAATGSGIDVYTFSIMKLSDASFKSFGTFTNHA